jgi:Raf kinase inhibitor-like YbhB/YbcL family protein
MAFTLSSTAFKEGATIPVKHTCDGADVSPSLAWSGAPPGTRAFALIADDPDAPAGTWVHWVLYNVPARASALPENVAKTEALKDPDGAVQGRNDFPRIGYGGPCPPPGKPHRYFFKLYALDAPLGLKAGGTKQEVERAMQGHVLGMAQLMGTYARVKQ